MGYGFTNYECICGGIIQEEWDSTGTTIKCDSCNNPKLKEEYKMLVNLSIKIDGDLLKDVDLKDEDVLAEKVADALKIAQKDILRATAADYVVNIVALEDINYAIKEHQDEKVVEFFKSDDAFETLCHRLKHKIEWDDESIIHMLMDDIYDEKERYRLE